MTKNIDLRGLDRDTLLMVAVRACDRLCAIGNMLTTDEGDPDDTEEEFGLPASEIVEMAHDNMILEARRTVESIFREVSTLSSDPQPLGSAREATEGNPVEDEPLSGVRHGGDSQGGER